jgi:uncharacterized cupin superfamily protein
MTKLSERPARPSGDLAKQPRDGPPRCVVADPLSLKPKLGSGYPEPWASLSAGRAKRALGTAAGIARFGVNLTTLEPGVWSSQRHWHSQEDEFVLVLDGEVTLVTDEGETLLTPGMAAGFKGGVENGHCLINKSDKPATVLEIGDRLPKDIVHYSDVDMRTADDADGVTRSYTKAGERY